MITLSVKFEGNKHGISLKVDDDNKTIIESNLREAFDRMASSTILTYKEKGYKIK